MQTAEIDMTVDPVVELFLQHDALPRLLDNFKKSGVNLTSDDIT
jgi:hypothetical protein